ncbi:hypothetical protein Q7I15_05635 [Aeromonas veronii]|uniref:hypothetical protein n=1 Tax=Aeromonas veronii TaxID=654 RepID=UPI003004B6CA
MQSPPNTEQRNLAGLTPAEQVAMNTAGFHLLREIFAKASSSLDSDWLAISKVKKAAILTIARLPREELMFKPLSALPYPQRDAIRLAVIALEYQAEFRGGCDRKVWNPSGAIRPMRNIEPENKERANRHCIESAVQAGREICESGPRAIGQ